MVDPVNDPPAANPDSAVAEVGTPITIDVLANDSDVDGDPLTVAAVTAAASGSAVPTADGTAIVYTPAPGFVGDDTFTYAANDGTVDGNAATVTISVMDPFMVVVTGVDPAAVPLSSTTLVTITGSAFAPGAQVLFENGSGPAPTASGVVVAPDGKSLVATMTVRSGGPARDRVWDVRVTNPDGSTGVLVGGFTVTP
jgi:hypothetical protein